MRKINALFSDSYGSNQFGTLTKHANTHLNLQQLWEAVAPKVISQSSYVGSLSDGKLTICAYNAAVATKIKLTSANLLTQLQNLQNADPRYRECKVTAITAKVQVKSLPKRAVKPPRPLSLHAAEQLKSLADQLGDSILADKLLRLASKR